MDEEHISPKDKIIPLTKKEYKELAQALQWPGDVFEPVTNLTELSFIGYRKK